jgi:UDP-N-acetylglucosamine 1-carboxyvinyltransferase
MGARISGTGQGRILIDGVERLHGTVHEVIADRIEAGTYMIAAAMTEGDVVVRHACADHLTALIAKMRQAGIAVDELAGALHVTGPKTIQPVSVETAVHPGFPTDLQAQWMALMSLSIGAAQVTERVFENRFMHVPELQRMGADIQIKDNTCTLQGVSGLSGADVMVSDLRAGAALVLAGLAAKGKTVIHRVYHLDRGYENLEGKLAALGASISRSNE